MRISLHSPHVGCRALQGVRLPMIHVEDLMRGLLALQDAPEDRLKERRRSAILIPYYYYYIIIIIVFIVILY